MTDRYLADKNTLFSRLEAKPFFDSLTTTEKKYAHYMSRASFEGTRIIITQINPAALHIYDMILKIFTDKHGEMIDVDILFENSGVSKDAFHDFLQYSAQFLGNLSNYKSFGDEKFIPRIHMHDLHRIIIASGSQEALLLFKKSIDELYRTDLTAHNLLGFPEDGHVSGYYSENVTNDDIQLVQEFLEKAKLNPLNTRLFKDDTTGDFRLAIASAQENGPRKFYALENGSRIQVSYNDFSEQMGRIAQAIQDAIPYAANETQQSMLEAYNVSFRTGSIEAHKESQRYWLQDINPLVETNIGFVETYRDPQGVRAEWEGFVAMINKEQTLKFNQLVETSALFVSLLPWDLEFERETLNKPDFTSLEVLSFAVAGIPAGINIPNYSDITQVLGSKNVSLGNVLSARSPNEKFPFIRDQDLDVYTKYLNLAVEMQVGTHELGHGTGKLFYQDEDGNINFDPDTTVNPLTGELIQSWYGPGQNFNSKFKSIAASYEECRAECIALVVSTHPDILKIFGFEGQEAQDVLYVLYLSMARAGLCALEFYDPSVAKWGQAHMQARYALMRIMLDAGEGFLEIKQCIQDDKETLEIHLDKNKIHSVGAPAISEFLKKLQIFKALADDVNGTQLYLETTRVPKEWHQIRDTVIASKQPRKTFVQGNTFITADGQVVLKEYEPSAIGMIQSFVERRV